MRLRIPTLLRLAVLAVPLLLAAAPAVRADGEDTEEVTPAAGMAGNTQALSMLQERLATSDSYKVRAQAAVLLGRLNDPTAVPALVRALETDEHFVVRAAAATGLGAVGDEKCLEPLFTALLDPEPLVRDACARALLRQDARRSFETFNRYAHAEAAEQRKVAVSRLGDLARTGDNAATELLVGALGDEDEVRDAAASALADLPTDRAVPVLMGALQHDNAAVRANSARLLGARQDKRVLDALGAAYERPGEQERVKAEVRRALERQRPYINVTELAEQARGSPDKLQRARAARLLGVVGDPRSADALEELLVDSDPYIQGTAALALSDLGSVRSLGRLEEALKSAQGTRAQGALELAVKKLRRQRDQGR